MAARRAAGGAESGQKAIWVARMVGVWAGTQSCVLFLLHAPSQRLAEDGLLIGVEEDMHSLSPILRPTPRPSIVSTALLDDFARTLYKLNANISQMRTMCDQLGGTVDSHDHRAKLYARPLQPRP